MEKIVEIYDTTLRDGAQGEGVSFSLEDKLHVAKKLDEFGVDYIEGGWPGANPKDTAFFSRIRGMRLKNAKITAFGSTRRKDAAVEEDPNMKAIVDSGVETAAIFGKSTGLHVTEVLRTTPENNLRMIYESVRFLRFNGIEVIYDAEHFFDGFKSDRGYAIRTLEAAQSAGARTIALCDTNGSAMPFEVAAAVKHVKRMLRSPLGIHSHNDSGVAVANSIMAINSGATHVQGTINGYGERCGNADLCAVIPNLQIKMGKPAVGSERLAALTGVSRYVSELANLIPSGSQPYVGRSAFAHKAGTHVDAALKNFSSYEHVDPALIGNRRRILVSELAGKKSILFKAKGYGVDLSGSPADARKILDAVKSLENNGYQFEGAEGSFALLIRRALRRDKPLFDSADFEVAVKKRMEKIDTSATVEIKIGGRTVRVTSGGDGPVNALDAALRRALEPICPELKPIRLVDYKVRVLNAEKGTAAKVRVMVDSSDGENTWTTVGVSTNVIEASWKAMIDSLEYGLAEGIRKSSGNGQRGLKGHRTMLGTARSEGGN